MRIGYPITIQSWMTPRLVAQYKDASTQLEHAEAIRREALSSLELEAEQRIRAAGITNESLSFDLGYWGWDCDESPIGKCVYDSDEDFCHDNCLFCGHPEERK